MSDVASKGNRGFYSSFQYVTLIGGQLLVLAVLQAVNTAQMDAKTVTFVMTVVLIVFILLQPVFGDALRPDRPPQQHDPIHGAGRSPPRRCCSGSAPSRALTWRSSWCF